jgi:single-strand DNA-binding protein
MNNLNSILIEGNLTRDPLLISTAKGTSHCSFTIATNRFYRHDAGLEKEVSFFEVETWANIDFIKLLYYHINMYDDILYNS